MVRIASRSRPRRLQIWFGLTTLIFAFASPGSAELHTADTVNPCGTQIHWEQEMAARVPITGASGFSCPEYGPCDDPVNRDNWTPDEQVPITYVRLAIHGLAYDDGTYPITTASITEHAVDLLNQYYLPSRIQFDYVYNQLNASEWRILSSPEIDDMKSATAIDPDRWLNIWITAVDYGYSFGTFPFSDDALEATGGAVIAYYHWSGDFTHFAHEVGHCLGLWHTFHGASEVDACGPCYEYVGAPDTDHLGDFCSDTPPSPPWWECSSASGADSCSGLDWGFTHPENFMSYAPDDCRTLFTTQQQARMRCWFNDRLTGWVSGVLIEADTTFGEAPFDVGFNALSFRDVTSVSWDFGDGATAPVLSPSHTYTQAGLYSVTAAIETTDGPFEDAISDFIWVYADTAIVDNTGVGPEDPLRVEIALSNHLPLQEIILPFQWSSENQLELDSISTSGLRTAGFETQSLIDVDNDLRRGTVQLRPSDVFGGNTLAPGASAVVSLHFTSPTVLSDTTFIDVAPYGSFSPLLVAPAGSYSPATVPGALFSGICCEGFVGDVNGQGGQEPTIGDVSTLIDALFISEDASIIPCLGEADINQSGGVIPRAEDITVGDISYLIDYLYIAGQSIGLPECM
jgi:PKD repeat protein